MTDNVDLLLITVNPHETKAVMEQFQKATGQAAQGRQIANRTYRDLGTVNGTRVFHALSQMGSGSLGAAHQTVQKAIAALKPKAVIAIGIAFGLKEDKQKIGDVLVSKQLSLYELQRIGATTTILRGDKPHASPWLIDYFEGIEHTTWNDDVKVKFGLLLSGEKLVDNPDFRKQLIEFEPEAIGGEMEGAGLYVGAHEEKVDWIVVKAICDWALNKDTDDKDAIQKQAADNAVRFLLHALNDVPLVESNTQEETSHGTDTGSHKSDRSPLKRSRPDLLPLDKPQVIEFQGGEPACNQMVRVDTVLPELIAFSVDQHQWSNYRRVDHLSKDGKIVYSNEGIGSSGGHPLNHAVPMIATWDGQKLSALKYDPNSIRDKVVGIAIASGGRSKIERWGRDHKNTVELDRMIERYDLSENEIEQFLDESDLLTAAIDGIVFDEFANQKCATSVNEKLQTAGLKMYQTNSPKPTP